MEFSTPTYLQVDDANRRINGGQGSNIGLQLDFANFLFYLGDQTGFVNGTQLEIDDIAKMVRFKNATGSNVSLFLDMQV